MNISRHDNEEGFTLIELLVGMAMALVISAAAATMFISILHRQPEATAAADVIGTARNAVEKITADIREGKEATVSDPSEMVLKVPCTANADGCDVTYQCEQELGKATFGCTRTTTDVATPDEARTTVARGLSSDQVFCVYPTPEDKECGVEGTSAARYVGIKLEFPNHKDATGTTVLEDGAALHNLPEALLGG